MNQRIFNKRRKKFGSVFGRYSLTSGFGTSDLAAADLATPAVSGTPASFWKGGSLASSLAVDPLGVLLYTSSAGSVHENGNYERDGVVGQEGGRGGALYGGDSGSASMCYHYDQ